MARTQRRLAHTSWALCTPWVLRGPQGLSQVAIEQPQNRAKRMKSRKKDRAGSPTPKRLAGGLRRHRGYRRPLRNRITFCRPSPEAQTVGSESFYIRYLMGLKQKRACWAIAEGALQTSMLPMSWPGPWALGIHPKGGLPMGP